MAQAPICIYHAHCTDGFTAAWAAQSAFTEQLEMVPASYGNAPPEVAGRDVIIVDFSYKRETLLALAKDARSVVVLDHHKTAEAELVGFPNADDWDEVKMLGAQDQAACIFDMNRSGAQLAWDFFRPGYERPQLIDYVADRDLWRWEMPDTHEINAAISSEEQTHEKWSDLAMELDHHSIRNSIANEGRAILRKQRKDIDTVIGTSSRTMMIGGSIVPVANCPPFLASETAGQLAKNHPFAATYYDGPKGRAFSLRSRGDDGADVSDIAREYGGGGHRNAAGFLMPRGWEGDA